jgi:hypothetical protein
MRGRSAGVLSGALVLLLSPDARARPAAFVPNEGQLDRWVLFAAADRRGHAYIGSTGLVMALKGDRFEVRLRGADACKAVGVERLPGVANFYLGRDRARWRSRLPTFREVRCPQVWPGVDLRYRGQEDGIEYDFLLAPGARPERIRLGFPGAALVAVDERGDLRVRSRQGTVVVQRRPRVFQSGAELPARYRQVSPGEVGIEVQRHDDRLAALVDPLVVYATYLGGSADEISRSLAVGPQGDLFVIGLTTSMNFPVAGTSRPYAADYDVSVTRLSSDGQALLFSTYLGGRAAELDGAVAIAPNGDAVVCGATSSDDFPVANAFQTALGGNFDTDAFVARLGASGNLLWSTYYGGRNADLAHAIAVDAAGNVVVAGETLSSNLPLFGMPYQGNLAPPGNADVMVFSLSGNGVPRFATYLGGGVVDIGYAVALDGADNIYVAGRTTSPDFPAVAPAFPYDGGLGDAFVSKLGPGASTLVFSTFLGGTLSDAASTIAVDATGAIYVGGQTASTNFPAVGGWQTAYGGNSDGFIARLQPDGATLVFSTFVGGNGSDDVANLLVHGAELVFTGAVASTDLPFVAAFADAGSIMLGVMPTSGGAPSLLSPLPAAASPSLAQDDAGYVYITARSDGTAPVVAAVQPSFGGGVADLYVLKLDLSRSGGFGDAGTAAGGGSGGGAAGGSGGGSAGTGGGSAGGGAPGGGLGSGGGAAPTDGGPDRGPRGSAYAVGCGCEAASAWPTCVWSALGALGRPTRASRTRRRAPAVADEQRPRR